MSVGLATAAAVALALAGCPGGPVATGGGGEAAPPAAESIGPHECGLCGMTIREQPAPRAQLVHRDGTRVMLCSVSELRDYLAVPSPHGKPAAVWVEVLPADWVKPEQGAVTVSPQLPWVAPADAAYVVGVHVPSVMGQPMLAFATRAEAEAAARRYAGTVRTWDELGGP